MSAAFSDIYASAPLQRLLADEVRGVMPDLQRCRGAHGLLVSAVERDEPPAAPLLSCWTRLMVNGREYGGDVAGRTDEPLAFLDDAFELVVLRHALEAVAMPMAMLDEAMRVLAPGGLLVLSGLHPLSLWTPWVAWRTRQRPLRLHMPLQVGEWLRRRDMQIECVRRLGQAWPGVEGALPFSEALGGAYVLMARKRRSSTAPVRLIPRALRTPADVRLAPGARRHIA